MFLPFHIFIQQMKYISFHNKPKPKARFETYLNYELPMTTPRKVAMVSRFSFREEIHRFLFFPAMLSDWELFRATWPHFVLKMLQITESENITFEHLSEIYLKLVEIFRTWRIYPVGDDEGFYTTQFYPSSLFFFLVSILFLTGCESEGVFPVFN